MIVLSDFANGRSSNRAVAACHLVFRSKALNISSRINMLLFVDKALASAFYPQHTCVSETDPEHRAICMCPDSPVFDAAHR